VDDQRVERAFDRSVVALQSGDITRVAADAIGDALKAFSRRLATI